MSASRTRAENASANTRKATDVQRVNVDFPEWVVRALDKEATRVGITRQALIKVWITERVDKLETGGALENDFREGNKSN